MPSVNPIRKEILQALEQQILPALWQPDLSLGLVVPPLNFSGNIQARLLENSVPRKDSADVEFPLQARWSSVNLHSSHYPYLGFLYEGRADEKTIITEAQAAEYEMSKGVYAISWQAPSVLLFPTGTPRQRGESPRWERPGPVPPMKFLWLSLGAILLIHTHVYTADGHRHVSHSLQINDSSVNSLTGLFLQEIQNIHSDNQQPAQAVLLAVMLRLQNILQTNRVTIANTSRSAIPTAASQPSDRAAAMCRDAAIYIQMHLHESLSLPLIAAQVSLSPSHLNRLFRRFYGISVMHYTRTQRIAAAKGILQKGTENITEIAQLVGFKRTNLFCRAFRLETGLTPGQFRRSTRRNENEFPHTL